MEVTEQYKLWIDECSQLFGGLDICALDLLHSEKEGRDYILELNDTAIGLVHKYEKEDMLHIRDIVLMRMKEAFPDEEKPSVEDAKWLRDQLAQANSTIERETEEKNKLLLRVKELEESLAKKKDSRLFKF